MAEVNGRKCLRSGWLHVKVKEKKRMSAGSYGGMSKMGMGGSNLRGWNLRWAVLSPHLLSVYAKCQQQPESSPSMVKGVSEGAAKEQQRKSEKDGQHYVLVHSVVSIAPEKAEKYPFVFKITTAPKSKGDPGSPQSLENSPLTTPATSPAHSDGGGGSGGKRKSVSAFFKRRSAGGPEAAAAMAAATEREKSDILAVAIALDSGRVVDNTDPQAFDAAVASAAAAEESQRGRHGRGSIGIRRFSGGSALQTSSASRVIYFYSASQR
jgi:hypothetical protein